MYIIYIYIADPRSISGGPARAKTNANKLGLWEEKVEQNQHVTKCGKHLNKSEQYVSSCEAWNMFTTLQLDAISISKHWILGFRHQAGIRKQKTYAYYVSLVVWNHTK